MKERYKKDFIHAGAIAKEVRAFGKSLIVPGASYTKVILQILEKIKQLGAIPAFPPQIALDDVAAHFLPQPGTDIELSGKVVKLDVGICYNGAIGDCAVTVDLSGKHQKLVDAAELALLNAEKILKVGLPVREIGKVIESTIHSFGLKPIRNLCGHGLGPYKIHTSPSIPNCDDRSTAVLKPGMTFAIEPFATNGKGLIYESTNPTLFSFVQASAVQGKATKELLKKIKTFFGLPFSMDALLSEEMTLIEVRLGITELLTRGAIAGYPPLIEEGHGMVAQAENSVLIDESGQVFITTR
jgi:methionyl aminopeptidase